MSFIAQFFRLSAMTGMRLFDLLASILAPNKDVLEKEDFPYYQILHDNYHVFLKEYNNLAASLKAQSLKDFYRTGSDEKVKHDDNWKAIPILLFNYIFEQNAEKCPETFKIIGSLPGCCSIMFSIMGAGKYVPKHNGIYKGFYRCLLTLQMEENGICWISINDKKYMFRVGECIVFDETVTHEVKNETNMSRVALYLDFYRKLPFPLNYLNDTYYAILRKSYYVKGVLNEYKNLHDVSYRDFKMEKPELK